MCFELRVGAEIGIELGIYGKPENISKLLIYLPDMSNKTHTILMTRASNVKSHITFLTARAFPVIQK